MTAAQIAFIRDGVAVERREWADRCVSARAPVGSWTISDQFVPERRV